MRAWARMHGNELALVFLAVLTVAIVLAMEWLEPFLATMNSDVP